MIPSLHHSAAFAKGPAGVKTLFARLNKKSDSVGYALQAAPMTQLIIIKLKHEV